MRAIIIVPVLTLAALLLLLVKFGRRKPPAQSVSPPAPDGGPFDSYGLPTLPGAKGDGGLFGNDEVDSDLKPGGGDFGGGGASGDWGGSDDGGDG